MSTSGPLVVADLLSGALASIGAPSFASIGANIAVTLAAAVALPSASHVDDSYPCVDLSGTSGARIFAEMPSELIVRSES